MIKKKTSYNDKQFESTLKKVCNMLESLRENNFELYLEVNKLLNGVQDLNDFSLAQLKAYWVELKSIIAEAQKPIEHIEPIVEPQQVEVVPKQKQQKPKLSHATLLMIGAMFNIAQSAQQENIQKTYKK